LSVLEKGKESVSFWQILFYFSDEWSESTSWQGNIGEKGYRI
jgi:hypothetical protein